MTNFSQHMTLWPHIEYRWVPFTVTLQTVHSSNVAVIRCEPCITFLWYSGHLLIRTPSYPSWLSWYVNIWISESLAVHVYLIIIASPTYVRKSNNRDKWNPDKWVFTVHVYVILLWLQVHIFLMVLGVVCLFHPIQLWFRSAYLVKHQRYSLASVEDQICDREIVIAVPL